MAGTLIWDTEHTELWQVAGIIKISLSGVSSLEGCSGWQWFVVLVAFFPNNMKCVGFLCAQLVSSLSQCVKFPEGFPSQSAVGGTEQIDGIEQSALKHCREKISFCLLGRAFNYSSVPVPLLFIFFSSSKSMYRNRCDSSWNFKPFGVQCVFLHFSIQWSIHLHFPWPQNCWVNCSCYRSIVGAQWPPHPCAPFPAPAQDKESSSDSQCLTMVPPKYPCLQNIPA